MGKITVLVADDHAFVRMGIASLLSTEDDIEIVANAKNGNEAVRLAIEHKPDVAIIDLMMPKKDGATATAEIKKSCPDTKVIIITSFAAADGVAHAVKAGAVGVVPKDSENVKLINAIRKVVKGGTAIPPDITKHIVADPPIPKLTERQFAVLESMTRGLTNRDIAKQLGLSEIRIEEHVSQLLTKIGAANRTEAVAIALRKQLLKI